ncbi:hypothetical protein [Mammaliicoccus sp. H-M34]|uniref:hypothetical protein n=1 Tax=Mammaliicoccus sp. H-M34 TaxID=2898693 RepID=UPI001EFA5230|nr:hypothetical protein [Mammaliicoccus sp. H-M34]
MARFKEIEAGFLVVAETEEEKILLEKNDSQFLKFLEQHMNRLIIESHKKNLTHRSDQTASVQGV